MMQSHQRNSRPRWMNSWIIILTIAIVIPMVIIAARFQYQLSIAKAEFEDLDSRYSVKSNLFEEKGLLLKRIASRDKALTQRARRVMHALGKTPMDQLDQFPVATGEFVVSHHKDRDDGTDSFIYLPEGIHTIALAFSMNVLLGHSDGVGYGGVERKKFDVSGGRRILVKTRLKNQSGKCWVTSVLLDENGSPLDQCRFSYDERTETGRFAGYSSGNIHYLPGDDYLRSSPLFHVSQFHMKFDGQVSQKLSVRIDLEPRVEKEFIRIENVATYLERAQFEYAFQPEAVDGKLMLTEVGKKFFQQENWMLPRNRASGR